MARVQQPDGTYKRLYPQEGEKKVNSQQEQYELFKWLRESTSCVEVEEAHVSRTVIEDENEPKVVVKQAAVSKVKPVTEQPQAASVQPPAAPEHREPKTFMERLKYLLFGKF